jgi:hypothetical protein
MNYIIDFHNDLHHIFKKTDPETNVTLDKAWNDFFEILNDLQQSNFEYSSNVNTVIRERLIRYLLYADVYLSDIFCSKQMLYNGFILQSSILLRPTMELSITLSILVATQQFDKWCNGEKVKVLTRVSPKKIIKKALDDCTYGNLLSAYEITLEKAKTDKSHLPKLFGDIADDILRNHRSFKNNFNIDKFIHRDFELLSTQKNIIRDYILSKKNRTEAEFSAKIIPLYQRLYREQIVCLIRTILALYYDTILITGAGGDDGDIPYIKFSQKLIDVATSKIDAFEKTMSQ